MKRNWTFKVLFNLHGWLIKIYEIYSYECPLYNDLWNRSTSELAREKQCSQNKIFINDLWQKCSQLVLIFYLPNVKCLISAGDKNISNSLSRACLISTPVIESMPKSASVVWTPTDFGSFIPKIFRGDKRNDVIEILIYLNYVFFSTYPIIICPFSHMNILCITLCLLK